MYGLNTWLPQIMKAAGYPLSSSLLFLVMMNVGAVVGSVLVAPVGDRLGMKPVTVVTFVAAALSIYLLSSPAAAWAMYALVAVAGFGTIGTQIMINAYVAMHFPPEVRATALGWTLGIGRLGAVVGPTFGGILLASDLAVEWNFYAFAIPAAVGAFMVFLLPGGVEQPLPCRPTPWRCVPDLPPAPPLSALPSFSHPRSSAVVPSVRRPSVTSPCLPPRGVRSMNRTRWRRGRRAVTLLAAASTLASVTTGVATADDSMSQALVPWRDQAGPAVFHQPPPRAPQLESTGIWKAEPTQVCMTSAYRRGEFLYQGCLWDDQGAGAPLDWPAGTMVKAYTYPKDPVYRSNAADLVELRARPLPDATAFRLTFNTMTDPDLVATTIALGDSPTPVAAPFGANTVMPAQTFVTVHGRTAEVVDAKTGDKAGSLTATVDTERRQIEVRVPHSAFDPTGRTAVRLAAATGLWDKEANRYLIPQALADEKHPGVPCRPRCARPPSSTSPSATTSRSTARGATSSRRPRS